MSTMSIQESDKVVIEARTEPRRRVLFSGLIVHSAAQMSIHCAILDMSRRGARVRLTGADFIGDPLYLIDLNHALAFKARVVWRRGERLSLSFSHYFDLSEPAAETPTVLRRLWLSHTRSENAP
ncbi:MAG TPA: PilZ domain-containing protein [Caulobacteraceae bacterium]